jgi:hypothetical protein
VRSPIAKISLVTAAVVVVVIALIVLSVLQQAKVSCEVCITFRGNTRCRAALGPDRGEAIKTATDNVCGFLAGGMADTIACNNTLPTSVTCDDDQAPSNTP